MLFFTGVHSRANTHLSRCQKFFSRTYSNRIVLFKYIKGTKYLISKYRMLISHYFSMYTYLIVYISADPLECPSGTLAYGMTLFIPESVYWRDPDLGPPPISNAPMPVSVCLLCGRITEIHREGNREFETLSPTSTEIRNLPSYQVCIGKGQISTVEFI